MTGRPNITTIFSLIIVPFLFGMTIDVWGAMSAKSDDNAPKAVTLLGPPFIRSENLKITPLFSQFTQVRKTTYLFHSFLNAN